MKISLGYNIFINEKSTLNREAITIHDPALPLTIDDSVPVSITSGDRHLDYATKFKVKPEESLSAIEIKFVVFDVFGRLVRTLVEREIGDLPAGEEREFSASWSCFSENEGSEFYASVAYVSRVRTTAGKVIEADTGPVLAEIARFTKKFSAEDLEPRASK